jgi:hypothetical protein
MFARDGGVAAFVALAVIWVLGALALPRRTP